MSKRRHRHHDAVPARRNHHLATWFGLLFLACTGVTSTETYPAVVRGSSTRSVATAATAATEPKPARATPALDLNRILAAVAKGRYTSAERELRQIVEQRSKRATQAELALAEVEAMTGRWDSAIARARPYCENDPASAEQACPIVADLLRRRGNLEEAQRLLVPRAEAPAAARLRLTLAEVQADRGQVSEARRIYHRLVDELGRDPVEPRDAKALAIAGRAAHRLGAWREANDLFNRAEMTGVADLQTLIWRAELYLDAHDPNHARAVSDEALRFAPEHPSALLLGARVLLGTAQEGERAERYLQQLLTIDPTRGDAYAVLVGFALRDLDFDRAAAHLEHGLAKEPKNLELLSLRAVHSFLADDQKGYDEAVHVVLRHDPNHARVYQLVAEYAGAEHRYGDTIPLLRRAVELDPEDPIVRAQLGIQLLRSGSEDEGRKHLSQAFARNPFDLRARNTLALYERKIDKEYVSVPASPFALRLPTQYSEVLRRVVPAWLDAARSQFEKRYRTALRPPVHVELYGDQDSFGVRTSGVPATFLQGACFGRTVVARLPTDEPTNLGMTLWHELSHVYHLQLSKQRVPRWFTEGLAEIETARHRKEWAREQDLSLYRALREGRLPAVKQMNRAFSHAGSLGELAVAYVASTYLVGHILERYGSDRVVQMLRAWGQRKSTEEVVKKVLGTDLDRLDAEFREALQLRLARLDGQFLPREHPGSLEAARLRVATQPSDPAALAALAHAELLQGQVAAARQAIEKGREAGGNHPDLLWVSAMIGLADQDSAFAERALTSLVAQGVDGYFVRMQLALLARMKGDIESERAALKRAHEYHPTASEPLYRLAAGARDAGDREAELASMSELAHLEETDIGVHRRLVELLLDLGRVREAAVAAEGLDFVNPLDSESWRLQARVALASRDRRAAVAALERARMLTPAGGEREKLERLIATLVSGKPRLSTLGAELSP